ncbi:hypothetical protein ACQ4LE_002715 [Meloidogyne hapla]
MTCGLAVKRPLDLGQDAFEMIDVKRARQSGASPKCSPFRPQLGILATSLNQSTGNQSPKSSTGLIGVTSSPFAEISGRCQLSSNQLDSYLRAEIQHLKRRKLIPRRANTTTNSLELGSSTANFRKANSPTSSISGSDSDGEIHGIQDPEKQRAAMLESLYEKPHFSLRQVKLICERLLKEQEIRLRYEYETILNKKLDEQHDQYVQFAKEQLEVNATKMGDISYLS